MSKSSCELVKHCKSIIHKQECAEDELAALSQELQKKIRNLIKSKVEASELYKLKKPDKEPSKLATSNIPDIAST